jgi:hypothetical protein
MQSISKDAAGQVTGVTGQLNVGGDFKSTKLKLTWLADVPELVPLVLTEFDYLITKKKVRCRVCVCEQTVHQGGWAHIYMVAARNRGRLCKA